MISTFRVKANPLSWVVCRSEYGRLGLGPGTGDAKVPAPVPALADKTCVEVACGTAVSFAVTDSGSSPRDSAIVLPVKFLPVIRYACYLQTVKKLTPAS